MFTYLNRGYYMAWIQEKYNSFRSEFVGNFHPKDL